MTDTNYTSYEPKNVIVLDDHRKGGGGEPPGGDKLEVRVEKLERIAEDTRGTLESIQRQLARMDAKLDGKPDQGWIVGLVCSIFGLVLAATAVSAAVIALMK